MGSRTQRCSTVTFFAHNRRGGRVVLIQMQKALSPTGLSYSHWDVAITGPVVDDRGNAACDFAKANSSDVLTLTYDESAFQMTVGERIVNAEDIADSLAGFEKKRILLEAT